MEVKACRGCGRLFNYLGFGPAFCPECKDSQEAKYQEVKEYVWEHKGVNIATVSSECDVSENQIREWIREGRLEFAPGIANNTCEKCEKTILGGRFCDACKKAMVDSLNSVYGSKAPAKEDNDTDHNGPRMRFI